MTPATSLRHLDESHDPVRFDPYGSPPEPHGAPDGERSEWGVWTIQLHPRLHRQRSHVFAHDPSEARSMVEANLHRRVGKWIVDPFQVPEVW